MYGNLIQDGPERGLRVPMPAGRRHGGNHDKPRNATFQYSFAHKSSYPMNLHGGSFGDRFPAIGFLFLCRSGFLQSFQLCQIVSGHNIVVVDP